MPQFGIRKAEDGNWYWTMDGKWVVDDAGQRVRAVGKDGTNGIDGENGKDGANGADGAPGTDGVTPQFKIENSYWFVSYDKGLTWSRLGKATGKDGEPGKDANTAESVFKDVAIDDNNVVFTLKDGTVITINKNRSLRITFEDTEGIMCAPGKTVRIPYTITGGDTKTFVECMADEGWKARAEATDTKSGHICVTAPDPMVNGKVLVFVNAGDGRTYVTKLTIVEGHPMVENSVFYINYKGGTVEVSVTTKENYEVKIAGTPAWIALEPASKAAERVDVLKFTVQKNPFSIEREAEVQLYSESGDILESFKIRQYKNNSSEGAIIFADPDVEKLCVGAFDTDGDGYVSFAEAAAVETLGSNFFDKDNIDSFDELQYFTGLKTLGSGFYGCDALKTIIIPDSVTEIPDRCFYSCGSLYSVVLPNNLVDIGNRAFYGCYSLSYLKFPTTLKYIRYSAFHHSSLVEAVLPEGFLQLEYDAFRYCSALSKVVLPSTLDYIGTSAFRDCISLEQITVPDKVTEIQRNTFDGCMNLSEVNLPQNLSLIEDYAFNGCKSITTLKLPERLLEIQYNAFSGCTSLKTIEIPKLVNKIGNNVFNGCTALKSVVLSNLITKLENNLFNGCTSLEYVTIGKNVTSISYGVFADCKSLNELICLPTLPPSLQNDQVFTSVPSTLKIKVPAQSVDAYKSKQYWSNHAAKIVAITEE